MQSRQAKLLILLIVVISSGTAANALLYDLRLDCDNDVCIHHRNASFLLSVINVGPNDLDFLQVSVVDSASKETIALLNETVTVMGGTEKIITIPVTLPPARIMVYSLCYTLAIPTHQQIIQGTFIGDSKTYCEPRASTSIIVQCKEHSDCHDIQYCENSQCILLDCKNCSYASYHQCVEYQCCSDDQCRSEQYCAGNKCAKLKCGETEFAEDHICKPLVCGRTEAIINRACVDLGCKSNEIVENGACVELQCMDKETAIDHKCVELTCTENEVAKNHTCQLLNCSKNEIMMNHSCETCSFYQLKSGDACITDKILMGSLLVELVSWMLIGLLSTLVVLKFKRKNAAIGSQGK